MSAIGFSNPIGPGLTRAASFGVVVAGTSYFGVFDMVERPIAGAIAGTVGSAAYPLATVVSFGALLYAYDQWIWPFLHQYI